MQSNFVKIEFYIEAQQKYNLRFLLCLLRLIRILRSVGCYTAKKY